MSFTEDEPAVFSAEELLTLDERQLVAYMKRNACAEGGYDISKASDLDSMPRPQRDELSKRVKAAAQQVGSAAKSTSLDISTLLERLAKVASDPNSSSEDRRPRRPRGWSLSSTELPTTSSTPPSEIERIESIYREELLQHGGRPVAIEILSQTLREQKDVPWLDEPGSGDRDGGVPRVFSTQADRWWEFLKWQIDNRGPVVGYDVGSTYVAAQRCRHSRLGDHRMVAMPTFDETVRRMWEFRQNRPEVPSGAGLPAYEEAVKRRLASHNIIREFQLKDDPREQGVWTTWVEYLNFEYCEADRLVAIRTSSEPRFRKAWKEFLRLDAPKSWLGKMRVDATSDQQLLAKEQFELKALREKTDSFIRETATYRRRDDAVRRQNIVTRWALKQLHLIEAEAAQERKAMESDQDKMLPGKKRRRSEDKEAEAKDVPAEPESKRLRRGDALGAGTAQHSTRGRPGSSSKATAPTKVTRQLRRPRQVANPQTNANSASQRTQRPGQRSHATAGQSTSLSQRKSKRLHARSQAAREEIT